MDEVGKEEEEEGEGGKDEESADKKAKSEDGGGSGKGAESGSSTSSLSSPSSTSNAGDAEAASSSEPPEGGASKPDASSSGERASEPANSAENPAGAADGKKSGAAAEAEADSKLTPEEKEKQAEAKAKAKQDEEARVLREKVKAWEQVELGCLRKFVPANADASVAGTHELYYVDEGLPIVTPRFDKTVKNPLLETRHAFLSLCTANRYQFDMLRRAKHSTMMVLYHLHNPEAPAHLYTCNECSQDILTGFRYHCSLCNHGDFDLCHNCATRANHEHPLVPLEVTRGVDVEASEAKRKQRLTEQRRSRQRSLQLFLRALVHASSCQNPMCAEQACKKMKELLSHRLRCTIRVRKGCEICRRVLCLVQMHARTCQATPCPVPHCDDLKRHHAQQQQAQAQAARARQAVERGGSSVVEAEGTKLKIKLGGGGGSQSKRQKK